MSEKQYNVRCYADSLGLPRVGVVTPDERYMKLLTNYWVKERNYDLDIIDRSKPGQNVVELHYSYYQDTTYFGNKFDAIIIQVGIVDCAPRPIPTNLRNFISKLPYLVRERIVKFIHTNRAAILKKGFKYYTVDINLFEQKYRKWLTDLKETNARIYIINIAPTNEKTEIHSPGLTESINKYNEVINKLVNEFKELNISLISFREDIIDDIKNINEYVLEEDGHHITARSHKAIFNIIKNNEDRFNK